MKPVTISSKYQVVIPREIREQFDLKPGRKIIFVPKNKSFQTGTQRLTNQISPVFTQVAGNKSSRLAFNVCILNGDRIHLINLL